MLRVPLAFAMCMASFSPAVGANVWLSSSGSIATGSTPPASLGSLQTVTHPPSDTQGTFYVWARPTAGKTLRNWSLRAISSNPSVVSLNTPSVEAFNPVLGYNGVSVVRWEFVGDVDDPQTPEINLEGLNIFGVIREGMGIGPGTSSVDELYHLGTNAWLLASIDYTLHGVIGQSAIHFQIGSIGMNHAEDPPCTRAGQLDCESGLTNVVFGLVTDPALNANTQRNTNSATADLFIAVSNTHNPTADFDIDGDIDGKDFLAWQRGFGITGGAMPSQGDANFDGKVNAIDLGFWQAQFGQFPSLAALSMQVPEPITSLHLAIVVLLTLSCLATRGRQLNRQPCPSQSARR